MFLDADAVRIFGRVVVGLVLGRVRAAGRGPFGTKEREQGSQAVGAVAIFARTLIYVLAPS